MEPLPEYESLSQFGQAPTGPTLQQKINAARIRNQQRLIDNLYGAAQQSQDYANVRALQNQHDWADLGTDSDAVRAVTGGLQRGIGTLTEGIGYISGEVVDNPLSSVLEGFGQNMTEQGKSILDSRSMETQRAIRDSQMTGNIFTGENLSFGKNPSLKGLLHQLLPTLAEMAPQMAALFVGGWAGAAASIGTGVAQAGISQGNQAYERIVEKSESELMAYSDAYRALREQNPNMTHEEAAREVADTGKLVAFASGGAVGGVGGALTRAIWKGPALLAKRADDAAGQAGAANLRAAAANRNASVTKGVAGRGALGFVEEGVQEVSESVAATAAVNKAIGAEEELGQNSLGEFVLGGLAGGTIGGVAGGVDALKQKAANRQEARGNRQSRFRRNANPLSRSTSANAEETAEVVENEIAKIDEEIKNGNFDELVDSPDYSTTTVAAKLVARAREDGVSTDEKKKINETLAKLDVATRQELEIQQSIAEFGVDEHFAEDIQKAENMIQRLQADLANPDLSPEQKAVAQSILENQQETLAEIQKAKQQEAEVSDEIRQNDIRELSAILDNIDTGAKRTRQLLRDDTPDDTDAIVTQAISETEAPETRQQAVDQLLDRAVSDPDKITSEQLGTVYSSGIEGLTDEQRSYLEAAIDVRESVANNENLANLQTRSNKEDMTLGYVSMEQYATVIDRALAAGNVNIAKRTLKQVENYGRAKRAKAQAAQKAVDLANRTGKQHAITPVRGKNGVVNWEISEHSFTSATRAAVDALLRQNKGLSFAPGAERHNLVNDIAAEADFIGKHWQLFNRAIKRTAAGSAAPTRATGPATPATSATPPASSQSATEATTPASTPTTPSGTQSSPQLSFDFGSEGATSTPGATPTTPSGSGQLELDFGSDSSSSTSPATSSETPTPTPAPTPTSAPASASGSTPVGRRAIPEGKTYTDDEINQRNKIIDEIERNEKTLDEIMQLVESGNAPPGSIVVADKALKDAENRLAEFDSAPNTGTGTGTGTGTTQPTAESSTTPASTTPAAKPSKGEKKKPKLTKNERSKRNKLAFEVELQRDRLNDARIAEENVSAFARNKSKIEEDLEKNIKELEKFDQQMIEKYGPDVVLDTTPAEKDPDFVNAVREKLKNMSFDERQKALHLAYINLGKIQQQMLDPKQLEVNSDKVYRAQVVVRETANEVFKGSGSRRIRELIEMINTPTGAPFADVVKWAKNGYERSSKPDNHMLKLLSKTDSYKDAKNVTFAIDTGTDAPEKTLYKTAGYSFETKSIFITPKLSSNKEERRISTERVVNDIRHEILHPITDKAYKNDPAFRNEVIRLQGVVRDWLAKPENREELDEGQIRLLEYATNADQPHELIPTVLGSSAIYTVLATVPDPEGKKTSVLKRLKDLIYTFIVESVLELDPNDVTKSSVLHSIIDLTDEAISGDTGTIKSENSKGNSEKGSGGNTGSDSTGSNSGQSGNSNDGDGGDVGSTEGTGNTGGTGGTSGTGGTGNSDGNTDDDADDDGDSESGATAEESTEEKTPAEDKDRNKRVAERKAKEKAVKAGKQPFFTFETDGDTEFGLVGPLTTALAETANLIRAHFRSRRRTPMSYSDNFMQDVFLSDDYANLESLSDYLDNPDRAIAKFQENGNPDRYRRVLKYYHSKWVERLGKNIKTDEGKHRFFNMASYFFKDGELDRNVASSIAMGAYNFLTEHGNYLYANTTDRMIMNAAGLKTADEITDDIRKMFTTIGSRENTVRQELGRNIIELMDLTIPDTTPGNEMAMLEAQLGGHALTLLLHEGFYQRNTYSGLDTRPAGIALKNKLLKADKMPSDSILAHRENLRKYLAKHTKDLLSPEEQNLFYQLAFEQNTFIRSNRFEQNDIQPIIGKLKSENLWPKNRLTRDEFALIVQDSKTLSPIEKARITHVYPDVVRPRRKNEALLLPHPNMSAVVMASKGSRSFMDNLLKRQNVRTLPTTDKSKAGFKDKTKNKSDLGIAADQAKKLDKAAKTPHTVHQGLLSTVEGNKGILTRLLDASDTFLPYLSGMKRPGTYIHVDDMESEQARTDLYIREAEAVKEHLYDTLEGDSTKPFFKNYAVWSNERMGEDSSGWNTQSSVMHRALESQPDWEFTVDPADTDAMETMVFKIAIAQGLGVGVDKMDIEHALKTFNNKLANPDIQAAMDLMDLMRNDPEYVWDENEQELVLNLAEKNVGIADKEGPAYFRAIYELAKYREAVNNNTSFTTDITAEVDGRANGPTIAMLQFGMNPKKLEDYMLLGGIIPVGSEHTNAGEVIQRTQNDIYKEVVNESIAALEQMREAHRKADKQEQRPWKEKRFVQQLGLLKAVVGDLRIEGAVTSAARNMVKEPITANVFGSGADSLVDTLIVYFNDDFRAKLAKYAQEGNVEAANTIIYKLNKILPQKHQIDYREDGDYTNVRLSPEVQVRIASAIEWTVGNATLTGVKRVFNRSILVGNEIKKNIAMVQNLYKAMYNAEKRILLNEQNETVDVYRPVMIHKVVKNGRRESDEVRYQPDLTAEQDRMIRERLKVVFPFIHSPNSVLEMNASKGMSMFTTGVKPSNEVDNLTGRPYDSAVGDQRTGVRGYTKLNTAVQYASVTDVNNNNTQKHMRVVGRMMDDMLVGIGALSKLTHTVDARIALETFIDHLGINTHDGFTSAANRVGAMGADANKALFETLMNYDAAGEIAKTVFQTIDAFNLQRGVYANDPQFLEDVEAALPNEYNEETDLIERSVRTPIEIATDLLRTAARANTDKLTMLKKTYAFDQYYFPGSSYVLTDADKKRINARLKETDSYIDDFMRNRSDEAKALDGLTQEQWLDFAAAPVNPDALSEFGVFDPEAELDAQREDQINTAMLGTQLRNGKTPEGIKNVVKNLQKINAALNKQENDNKLLIPALESLNMDDEKYYYYLGELLNPESTIMETVKPTHLKALRNWRDNYFTQDENKGTVYSLGIEPGPLSYTTEQVFDALDDGNLPDQEATLLKQYLKDTADKLYDTTGMFAGLTTAEMGTSVEELAARHTIENIGPFSSNLNRAGVKLDRAQSFVAEMIEMTMQESLASQTLADNSIVKLYQAAKNAFHPDGREFYVTDQNEQTSDERWKRATPEEKAQAKAAYDLIFTSKNSFNDSRSDHLSRFIALGLVYPPLRNKLAEIDVSMPGKQPDEKLGSRLSRYYNNTTQTISNILTNVDDSDPGNTRLEKLAKKLAMNEHQRRLELNRETPKSVSFVDDFLQSATTGVQNTVVKMARADMIANNKLPVVNGVIRGAAVIADVTASERVDQTVKILEEWRDSERKYTEQGFWRSLVNDVRGETDEKRQFFELLSLSKVIEQTRKQKKDITQQSILQQFKHPDQLTDSEKAGITQLYLRTDAQALVNYGYDVEDVHSMMLDETKRKTQIKALQSKLKSLPDGERMILDTKDMAYEMATGSVVSPLLYQNAKLVYTDGNTVNTDDTDADKQNIALIDELGTLLAIDYSPTKHHMAIRNVVARESQRGANDAFRYLMGLHKNVLDRSAETLFRTDLNLKKGYVRETYDPYTTYQVTEPKFGKDLIEQGYKRVGPLHVSSLGGERFAKNPQLYVLPNIGLPDVTTGAMQNVQMRSRGTLSKYGPGEVGALTAQRKTVKKNLLKTINVDAYRPHPGMEVHEAPVFSGEHIQNFRYMATHALRDTVMKRDNRFESVLAQTIGITYTKEESIKQNEKVIDALKEFYDKNFEQDKHAYVEVSRTSEDPRIREMYRTLPNYTRNYMRKKWGGNRMMIRKDLLDLTLGYRNLTTDQVINDSYKKLNNLLGNEISRALLGPKRANQVRRAHNTTVEIMRLYKNFIVVRNFETLYSNVKSNAVLLFMYKVPLMDIVRGHRRGFQGLRDYREAHKEMLRLQTDIDAALPGTDTRALKQQVKDLQHSLNRNPVKPLIDQGMFQTILDDVDLDKESQLYRTETEKFFDKWHGKLPKKVADAADFVMVGEDTFIHKMLSQGTQMSDFVARFVLYEHLQKQARKAPEATRMSESDINSKVRQAFVNYNVPSHPMLQFMNDVGLVMFTKYFLGTQKIIYERMKEAPSQTAAAFLADRYIDNLDTVLSSSFIGNIGNPLGVGPLSAPTVLDEPIVLKTLLGFI